MLVCEVPNGHLFTLRDKGSLDGSDVKYVKLDSESGCLDQCFRPVTIDSRAVVARAWRLQIGEEISTNRV